jgi:ferredoxin
MVVLSILNKDGNPSQELSFSDEGLFNTRLRRKKSILDLLLDNGVEIYFGCMGGSCSACVVTLLSGEEHLDREGLNAQIYKGIASNEILTCIATIKDKVPEDAKIVIQTKYN